MGLHSSKTDKEIKLYDASNVDEIDLVLSNPGIQDGASFVMGRTGTSNSKEKTPYQLRIYRSKNSAVSYTYVLLSKRNSMSAVYGELSSPASRSVSQLLDDKDNMLQSYTTKTQKDWYMILSSSSAIPIANKGDNFPKGASFMTHRSILLLQTFCSKIGGSR